MTGLFSFSLVAHLLLRCSHHFHRSTSLCRSSRHRSRHHHQTTMIPFGSSWISSRRISSNPLDIPRYVRRSPCILPFPLQCCLFNQTREREWCKSFATSKQPVEEHGKSSMPFTYQQHILRCIPPCVMFHNSFVVCIHCRREKLKLSRVG